MDYLRIGIYALAFIGFSPSAFAGSCDRGDEGIFVNAALNGEFERAYVKVNAAPKNTMIFEVMIPCGSKLTPATLYASCQENSGRYEPLVIQQKGTSQCSLGDNVRVSIIGDELTIFTNIRTPGFSGRYEFLKQL